MSSSTADNIFTTISEVKNDDGVCEVNDMLLNNLNISTVNNKEDNDISVCANCGKEGSDINNMCNKCKMANYCNAACKKKHRSKHKKQCEDHIRLAAERAAELHDKELFKHPPPDEDCPICFQRLPTLEWGRRYKTCCGKVICSGCILAPVYDNEGNIVAEKICPFCRTPGSTSNEVVLDRERNRMEKGDPIAIYNQGCNYREGSDGFPQDFIKALKLFHRAGKLGYARAYTNIGGSYDLGTGVEVDKEKAAYYYELAAMGGDVQARHNLGVDEAKAFNIDRAVKHFMIAVRSGCAKSLEIIKQFYGYGQVTKDDYKKALRLYQEYLGEIKSPQRDKAAEYSERYRYY